MSDKKNPPRVSVGLPVFNGELYLEEAIDSILTQTYTDFELIISDNGSTDSTPTICQRYAAADSRVTVRLNKTNRGGAWNFNYVFHESQGEYFKWACNDDIMAPTLLERCVGVLDEHPDAVLCYPKTLMIKADGSDPTPYDDNFHLVSASPVARFEHVLFRKEGRCNPALGVIRREPLATTSLIGEFPSSDEILLAELALLGKYFEHPEELAYRRDHPGTSVNSSPTLRDRYKWLNPANRVRVMLPTLRHFYEYQRSIGRSDIAWRQKWQCSRLACRKLRWSRDHVWREVKLNFHPSR